MFTVELPVLDMVTVRLVLVPTVVAPKLSDVGATDSCKVGASPVPDTATVVGDPGALLINDSEPENVVAEAGAKLSVNWPELHGASESGRARPLRENPGTPTVACETLKLAVPVFWIVIV